jgi:ComEC/Rec2-related protein
MPDAGLRSAQTERLPEAFNRSDSQQGEPPRPSALRSRVDLSRLRLWLAACLAEEAAFGHGFYWLPVMTGAGAVLWFLAPQTPSPVYLSAILVLSTAAATVLRHARPVAGLVSTLLACLCLGALSAAWETHRASTIILDTPVTTTVVGLVTGREAMAGGRWRYTVEVRTTERPLLRRSPAKVTLTAPGGKEPIALGAEVRGRARLLPPSGPALPGLNDFAFDAFFSGTSAIGFFYGRPDVTAEPAERPLGLISRSSMVLEQLRGDISARIRAVLPGDTGAFAASMVTDDRRAISRETTDALMLAGLTHIVAISGLNMALAAGIFFVGLRVALSFSQTLSHRYPVKRIAAAGALVTVTGYYLISGFAVSAERAYIMMAIMLTAAIIGRPSISLRNVALSALAIIATSPSAVMGPGFQMSYAATLALVAGYTAWTGKGDDRIAASAPVALQPLSMLWRFFSGVFVTSLIGGASTALFAIEHFQRIAVWGLLANLLAMPIISLIVMPAAVFALVMMPVGLDWLPLKLMGIGLDTVIAIAKWVASLGEGIATGRLNPVLFVGLTFCLLLLVLMRSRLRFAGALAGGIMLCVSGMLPSAARPDIVVYEDGELVGIVQGDRIATTQTRPSRFIFDQWLRGLPVKRHVTPIVMAGPLQPKEHRHLSEADRITAEALLAADAASAPTGRFRCRDGLWCLARLENGSRIIVTPLPDLIAAACRHADLVISSRRTVSKSCASDALLLSAESLRRSGTVEIRLNPQNNRHFLKRTGLGDGDRPWYVHRMYDWRSGKYIMAGVSTERIDP